MRWLRNGMEAVMAKKYLVTLEVQEREELTRLASVGKAAARKLTHARILLMADESPGGRGCKDLEIAEALSVSVKTVERVRQRFVEQGMEAALVPARNKRIYTRKLDGRQEAKLIAVACSKPPAGKRRWTLRLLADRVVEMQIVDSLSHETVRQTLKKTRSSRT
jgi:transposase